MTLTGYAQEIKAKTVNMEASVAKKVQDLASHPLKTTAVARNAEKQSIRIFANEMVKRNHPKERATDRTAATNAIIAPPAVD